MNDKHPGDTPNIDKFTPEVQALIRSSYDKSIQRLADAPKPEKQEDNEA